LPLRNAAAIASGTSASASTTFARFSCTCALNSCSAATAIARRFSAFACATRLSASAWSACRRAPMLTPMSTSAMSIETISNAVPASRPRASTVLLIESGFSSTSLCDSLLPIVDTMPSPTRAMIVSSPAPPTRRLMFVRTVTRALASTWMPFLATAATSLLPEAGLGQSMTFGVTLVFTASSTSRPARSMPAAVRKSRSMPARLALMSAVTTFCTRPPARRCASRSRVEMPSMRACTSMIFASRIVDGFTLRRLIANMSNGPMPAFVVIERT
jgi:hypothetical protein